MKSYDVLIIGGGAAGLTAALSASMQGAKATVLEAAPRIGRKILASGNGRCNLANVGEPRFYGNEKLAKGALRRCNAGQVIGFFEGLGLCTVEEEGGRVYPACGQAAAVLDVLRSALDRQHVEIICDAPVKKLQKKKGVFCAVTSQGDFSASRVIAACGGMAGGKLGHDGSAYGIMENLGHHLIAPRPALTQLITEKGAVKGLSGLRLPTRLTLCQGKTPMSAAQGEVLFTDYGISGVCAMQLSRDAGEMLEKGKKPVLYLDFSPMLALIPRIYDRVKPEAPFQNTEKMEAFLALRKHMLPKEDLLCGLAPRLLSQRLQGLPVSEMARMLSAFPAPVTGIRGFEYAQVTRGGLDGNEFDSGTMESRLVPGLYAAGEMLDVDGDCGGYNLLFAFSSGMIAGEHAARKAHSLK